MGPAYCSFPRADQWELHLPSTCLIQPRITHLNEPKTAHNRKTSRNHPFIPRTIPRRFKPLAPLNISFHTPHPHPIFSAILAEAKEDRGSDQMKGGENNGPPDFIFLTTPEDVVITQPFAFIELAPTDPISLFHQITLHGTSCAHKVQQGISCLFAHFPHFHFTPSGWGGRFVCPCGSTFRNRKIQK